MDNEGEQYRLKNFIEEFNTAIKEAHEEKIRGNR